MAAGHRERAAMAEEGWMARETSRYLEEAEQLGRVEQLFRKAARSLWAHGVYGAGIQAPGLLGRRDSHGRVRQRRHGDAPGTRSRHFKQRRVLELRAHRSPRVCCLRRAPTKSGA